MTFRLSEKQICKVMFRAGIIAGVSHRMAQNIPNKNIDDIEIINDMDEIAAALRDMIEIVSSEDKAVRTVMDTSYPWLFNKNEN